MSSIGSKSESNSPVPPGASSSGTPSPLIIGKSFIKQYYQVLSTDPDQITKFYKPNSVISHSLQPSVPTVPQTLSSSAADQFFLWAKTSADSSDSDVDQHTLCFDFGSGAIDAQESVNGGILLVVTGRITLPNQVARTFVHTFFLNNGAAPGKKRQFYVHNDILRFLEEGSSEGDIATSVPQQGEKDEPSDEEDAVAEVTNAMSSNSLEESLQVAPEQQSLPVQADIVEAQSEENAIPSPMEAEDEDEVDDEEDANAVSSPIPQAKDEKKSKKNRSRGRSRKARSSSPTDADKKGKPTKPKEPGSWASLVAGKSSSGVTKPSPVAAAAAEVAAKLSTEEKAAATAPPAVVKEEPSPKKSATQKASSNAAPSVDQSNDKSAAVQRTAEATILIKNLPDKVKEADIRAMFKPYSDKLNKKILGITLLASRGFAFVDFDSKVVADAVVKDSQSEKKGEEKFVLHGKVLDVGRKVSQENNSKSGGSSSGQQQRRSKSPGNTKSKGGRNRGAKK